jgi:hypothetical protein
MGSKLIVGVLILLTAAVGARPKQNTFAIYLFAAPVDTRTFAKDDLLWNRLALSSAPVISAADVISYDFSTHAMRLRSEAIKRLPKPPVSGIPFVVVVNGERIYLGAFYMSYSSITCARPVIVVDKIELDRGNTVIIDRAYPASTASGKDWRSDERVKDVLSKLRKLAVPLSDRN